MVESIINHEDLAPPNGVKAHLKKSLMVMSHPSSVNCDLKKQQAEDDEAPPLAHLICCEVNLLKKYTQPTFHLCAVGL